jgi:uncharacterized protein YjbJ (UPF0337 family)
MGAYKEQGRGLADQAKGRVKEKAGVATGDARLVDEGLAQQDVGRTRVDVARASERLKGAGEELRGSVKRGVGRVVDDERMQAKGTVDKAKGKLRGKLNK